MYLLLPIAFFMEDAINTNVDFFDNRTIIPLFAEYLCSWYPDRQCCIIFGEMSFDPRPFKNVYCVVYEGNGEMRIPTIDEINDCDEYIEVDWSPFYWGISDMFDIPSRDAQTEAEET